MFGIHFADFAVFFYPEGKDRVEFKGIKTEEGISKFLVKNMGDSILVIFLYSIETPGIYF